MSTISTLDQIIKLLCEIYWLVIEKKMLFLIPFIKGSSLGLLTENNLFNVELSTKINCKKLNFQIITQFLFFSTMH